MYCTNCGAKIEDDAVFCTNCGTRAESDSEAVQQDAFDGRQDATPNRGATPANTLMGKGTAPKKPRKPLDKRVIIGSAVAVVVVIVIAIGVFAVQRAGSAQGTWYAYDDYGEEYTLVLKSGGEGQDGDGYSFMWDETSDTVTTDSVTYTKEDGKLRLVKSGMLFYKNEGEAKADYDKRVTDMRTECDQCIEKVKKGIIGTWTYDDSHGTTGTFVAKENGTWASASTYGDSYNGFDTASCEGTWSIEEIENDQLPAFEDSICINLTAKRGQDYGDPVRLIESEISTENGWITLNGDGLADIGIGSDWKKASDEVTVPKAEAPKTSSARVNGEYTMTVHLSMLSKSGQKLEGDVKLIDGTSVIPDSSEREYTEDELKEMKLNDAELCIAWNEILARDGQHFEALASFFKDRGYKDKGIQVNPTGAAGANCAMLKKMLKNDNWKHLKGQKD